MQKSRRVLHIPPCALPVSGYNSQHTHSMLTIKQETVTKLLAFQLSNFCPYHTPQHSAVKHIYYVQVDNNLAQQIGCEI